jgi:menaquinone-specific isochorismate synthase
VTRPSHPDPGAFRALSVPLPDGPTIDPVAVAGDDGCLFDGPEMALAGRGAAAVLPLGRGLSDLRAVREAERWLAAVPVEDRVGRPGAGVVAFGAFPFDPEAPARLVVPRVTFGRDGDGRRWATVVRPAAEPETPTKASGVGAAVGTWLSGLSASRARAAEAAPHRGPTALPEVAAVPDPGEYVAAVAAAVAAIVGGRLAKVVLARRLDLRFGSPIDPWLVLRRLHQLEPACTAFSYPVEGGRFLGASPELLVSRRGPAVRSNPLAGTVALTGDPAGDGAAAARLLASDKDLAEHELVVVEIARALRAAGATLAPTGPPSVTRLGSVAHLATPVVGRLTDRAGGSGVLELLSALHPTPAVGGVPRPVALRWITELEAAPRRHWAGPVGWVDGQGDGDWMIGIRSARLSGPVAELWAGAGIVAGSDPAAELAETTAKLAPVVDALVPGASRAVLGDGALGDGAATGGVRGGATAAALPHSAGKG